MQPFEPKASLDQAAFVVSPGWAPVGRVRFRGSEGGARMRGGSFGARDGIDVTEPPVILTSGQWPEVRAEVVSSWWWLGVGC